MGWDRKDEDVAIVVGSWARQDRGVALGGGRQLLGGAKPRFGAAGEIFLPRGAETRGRERCAPIPVRIGDRTLNDGLRVLVQPSGYTEDTVLCKAVRVAFADLAVPAVLQA